MIWDSIRQYRQALSGRYDDWHPPAMNWLWRQLLPLGAGPAPMLVLQLALYWGGIALLVDAAARRSGWGGAAVLAVALLPMPVLLMGAVIKDSLMAAALVMATGLLIRQPISGRMARTTALLLLIGAATLRFNAVFACLPLAVAALPRRWTTGRRLWLAGIAAACALTAALPLANRLLNAERSAVEQSLIIYDLGGITRFSGESAFPDVGVADPVAVNAGCYTPVAWDRYAWWGKAPCAIGFAQLRPKLEARGATRVWLDAIARHPLAYAAHRLLHFNSEQRFIVRDADLPELPIETDPNPWNFRLTLAAPLRGIAAATLATPLGWPACWLAFGLGLLAAIFGGTRPAFVMPLLLSAMLYEVSYLPLGVASEARYHLWTMTALGLAGTMSALAGHGRRVVLALVVAAITALFCVGGRLLTG